MRRGALSFHTTGRAPRHIRQSRSCPWRQQSFAQSGVRHAMLPPARDGCSAPCGAELFLSSCAGRTPPHIRQSRSCPRREQSFAQSGVRHALLPPAVDGALLHGVRSSSSSQITRDRNNQNILALATEDLDPGQNYNTARVINPFLKNASHAD